MPSATRAGIRQIQRASDFGSAPGAGNTGYPMVWDNAQSKFVLSDAITVAIAAHVALPDPHEQYAQSSALGTAAGLNVGTGALNVVQLDGSARLPAVDGSLLTGISGGGTPGGSTTQVQYNNAGAFAGDAGMTYNATNDRLTVAGGLIAGDWSPPIDSTTAVSIWNAARSSRVVTVDTTNKNVGINITPSSTILSIKSTEQYHIPLLVAHSNNPQTVLASFRNIWGGGGGASRQVDISATGELTMTDNLTADNTTYGFGRTWIRGYSGVYAFMMDNIGGTTPQAFYLFRGAK